MTCNCCQSTQGETWGKLNVWRCSVCGYIAQISIQPVVYGKEYLRTYEGRPTVQMSWVRLGYIYRFLQSGTILDIGYGDGEFIRQARYAKYAAFGYDTHQDDLGVPTANMAGNWDAITMFDSWEHMPDLTAPLASKAKYVFLTVPHLETSATPEWLESWRHFKPNEHIHYFTRAAIHFWWNRHGYEVIDACPVEDVIRKGPESPNTMTYTIRRMT